MHPRRKLSRRAFLASGAFAAAGLAAGCASTAPPTSAEASPTTGPSGLATLAKEATPTEPPTSEATPTIPATPMATASVTMSPTQAPTREATPTTAATQPPTHTPAPPSATATTAATPTHTPTSEPTPTETLVTSTPSRENLLAHYPATAQSVLSVVQHDGVWNDDQIQEHVVLEMLDAAITLLTGLNDALAAWQVLFDPSETVGIKVNTISRYTTTPAVTYAVAKRLQEAGIPAEQIVIFDRSDGELKARGFTINADGAGVRCRGAKGWEQPVEVTGTRQGIHDVLLSCSALINIPAFKMHDMCGMSAALKNHYGSVHAPGSMHGNHCDPYIAELNAIPVIRDKTRLIVGDALRTCPYDWNRMTKENAIAMSFDPVAHDLLARRVLTERRETDGQSAGIVVERSGYLASAVELGLGADEDHIEARRAVLG